MITVGVIDQWNTIISRMRDEIAQDSRTSVRLLEKQLKLSYLSGDTSNSYLLRPELPDLPRLLDFQSDREKQIKQLKVRAKHQMRLIALLERR